MSEPLLAPRFGLPELIIDQAGFLAALESLVNGHGPIAVDAERASGYRYSGRAYLIQLFRRDGGLHLIDPIAIADTALWATMDLALKDCEWIIHASTQDLPCLRELGIYPEILFDTELGGRIAGCERVGLGPLCESLLELQLAKEHSAVDWSIRPLKDEWLNYAALDVDVLVDLRDAVEELLTERGKLSWAKEDFSAILNNPPNPPRIDPWRRTSGLHKVRDRMTLAIIKTLWIARDEFAREIDIAPGRIFNDEVLVTIATKRPDNVDEFAKIIKRRTRVTNIPTTEWFALLHQTLKLPDSELPVLRTPSIGLPPIKLWKERNPLGHARLSHARAAVQQRAAELEMPVENLVSPEVIRQLVWKNPPDDGLEQYIEEVLAQNGARAWQIAQIAPLLGQPMLATIALVAPVQATESGAEGMVPAELVKEEENLPENVASE
ncbi:MAG TPA: HRDC domain-containing protein [Candidatus Nanopelagicaceae bacterium]